MSATTFQPAKPIPFRGNYTAALTLLLLVIFSLAVGLLSHFKATANDEALAETIQSASVLYNRSLHFHLQFYVSDRTTSAAPQVSTISALDDLLASQTAQNISVFGDNFDRNISVRILFSRSRYTLILSRIPAEERDLFADRIALEMSLLHHKISKRDYLTQKQLLDLRKEALIQRMALEDSESQRDASSAALMKELAALKKEVQGLRAAHVRYGSEFWITLGVALCSLIATAYNFAFSFLRERREQRKDERDAAAVSLYSEADLQEVLSSSSLSTTLRD
jgi:hypothetical protein